MYKQQQQQQQRRLKAERKRIVHDSLAAVRTQDGSAVEQAPGMTGAAVVKYKAKCNGNISTTAVR